jgi:hypothetical protein
MSNETYFAAGQAVFAMKPLDCCGSQRNPENLMVTLVGDRDEISLPNHPGFLGSDPMRNKAPVVSGFLATSALVTDQITCREFAS